jgi:hypothetical protein
MLRDERESFCLLQHEIDWGLGGQWSTSRVEATTTRTNKVSMPSRARVLASHKRVFCRDVSAPWLLLR